MSEATRISPEDAIDRIWELAKSIDFCMFVTWDGERQRARPLSARPNRDEGRIYFLTNVAGAKDEQIEKFPKVTLAFTDTSAKKAGITYEQENHTVIIASIEHNDDSKPGDSRPVQFSLHDLPNSTASTTSGLFVTDIDVFRT